MTRIELGMCSCSMSTRSEIVSRDVRRTMAILEQLVQVMGEVLSMQEALNIVPLVRGNLL